MRALITGANGFLGRHVVAEFLRRGHAVRALVRPAARLEDLDWPATVEVIRADLRVAQDLVAAFSGVDVLVHLAAAVTGGEDAQLAATVVGTERLLDAMAGSQTRRLVLASSFSVYDWSAIRGTLTEESPLESGADLYERDGYAVAKAWQERVVRRAAVDTGWELTVLRPGFIWGAGNADLACLGQRLGPVHLVFGASTRIPLTHVSNCADLFATAAEDPRAIGETFNVVDDDAVRVWGYLGRVSPRLEFRGDPRAHPLPCGDDRRPTGALDEPADLPGQGETAEPARAMPVRGTLQAATVQQPQSVRGPGLESATRFRRLPSADLRRLGHRSGRDVNAGQPACARRRLNDPRRKRREVALFRGPTSSDWPPRPLGSRVPARPRPEVALTRMRAIRNNP